MNDAKERITLNKLECVLTDVRCGVMGSDTISLANDVLTSLGGPCQAGDRLDLFLQAIANGNPENLEAVMDVALECLTTEVPE